MCIDDLVANAYLTDVELSASEIPIVLAGCATSVTSSLVVTKADFEEVLVSARSASPAIASVILNLGTEKEPGAELWLVMLRNPSVKKKYEELRREQVEQQLNEAVPAVAAVPETIEEAEALPEKVEPVMKELLGEDESEEDTAPVEEPIEETRGAEEDNSLQQTEQEGTEDKEGEVPNTNTEEKENGGMSITGADEGATGFGTIGVDCMSGFDGPSAELPGGVAAGIRAAFGVDDDMDAGADVAVGAEGAGEMDIPYVEPAVSTEELKAEEGATEEPIEEQKAEEQEDTGSTEEAEDAPEPEVAGSPESAGSPEGAEVAETPANDSEPQHEVVVNAKAEKILALAREVMADFSTVWDTVGVEAMLASNNMTAEEFRTLLLEAAKTCNRNAGRTGFSIDTRCEEGIDGIRQILNCYDDAMVALSSCEDVDTIQDMLDPIMSLIYGED